MIRRTRKAMRARLAARDHAWQAAATRRRTWARRNALVLIGVLLLGAIAGACKTLDETAIERDRCHELGGEFWARYDSVFDVYVTSCDLSDPKETH